MKKQILLIIYMTLTIGFVTGQVTIGSNEAPIAGAILDLKQNGTIIGANSFKGLGLPRVNLKNNNTIEMGTTVVQASEYDDHKGLLVYNMTQKDGALITSSSEMLCRGLHVWDGKLWTPLIAYPPNTKNCDGTSSTPAITLNKYEAKILVGNTDQLTATISPATPGTITWTSNAPGIATVGATTGLLTPMGDGTAKVTATLTYADGTIVSQECEVVVGTLAVVIQNRFVTLLSGVSATNQPVAQTHTPIVQITPTWVPIEESISSWTSSNEAAVKISDGTTLVAQPNIVNNAGKDHAVVNAEVVLSVGSASANASIEVKAATLSVSFDKQLQAAVVQDERPNNAERKLPMPMTILPTWAAEESTLTRILTSDDDGVAKPNTDGTYSLTIKNFAGKGPAITTNKVASFTGKINVKVDGTLNIMANAPGNSKVNIFSANPLQITDIRGAETKTYWAAYYGPEVLIDEVSNTPKWTGVWMMAENLRTQKLLNGTDIPKMNVAPNREQFLYDFPGKDSGRESEGILYNLPSAMGVDNFPATQALAGDYVQGICPQGWMVPLPFDFLTAASFVGGSVLTYATKIITPSSLQTYMKSSIYGEAGLSKPKEKGGYDAYNTGTIKVDETTSTVTADASVFGWLTVGDVSSNKMKAPTLSFSPDRPTAFTTINHDRATLSAVRCVLKTPLP